MASGGFNKLNKVSCKGTGSIKIDAPVGQGMCFARVHAGSFAGAAGVARLRRPSGPKPRIFDFGAIRWGMERKRHGKRLPLGDRAADHSLPI